MTKWRDPKDAPYPGPHNADGRYIYGPGLKSLGRAFDTEDQPIETVCATARLWATAWEMLEVLKAQIAFEHLNDEFLEVARTEGRTFLKAEDQVQLLNENRRIWEARRDTIAKATGETP